MIRSMSALLITAVLAACDTGPVLDPDLDPVTRFELLAFREDDGTPNDDLYKWYFDRYTVAYDGPPQYRADVIEVMERIGELTGLPTSLDEDVFAKVRVQIGGRPVAVDRDSFTCVVSGADGAFIFIQEDLRPSYIRQCLWQEMGQALGLAGDLDGPGYSRDDTVFASWQTADRFTPEDEMMIRILFDPRLRDGMDRDEVMPIVRRIVAEMEAAE